MGLSIVQRSLCLLLTLLTLAVTSYSDLCAAGFTGCAPCQEQSGESNEPCCDLCELSATVADSIQAPHNPVHLLQPDLLPSSLDIPVLPPLITQGESLKCPDIPEPPRTRLLRLQTRCLPIRGPSIA